MCRAGKAIGPFGLLLLSALLSTIFLSSDCNSGAFAQKSSRVFRGVSKAIRCPAGVRGLDRAIWAGAEEFDVGCSSG